MGKQVRFYMSEEDEREFLNFAAKGAELVILPDRLKRSAPDPLQPLPPMGTPYFHSVWLWNKKISPVPHFDHIATQGYYTINTTLSEVVQFSRCHMKGKRLEIGRLWADVLGVDVIRQNGELVWTPPTKSKHFGKWMARLTRWIRKNGKRDQPDFMDGYVLPSAAEAAARGDLVLSEY